MYNIGDCGRAVARKVDATRGRWRGLWRCNRHAIDEDKGAAGMLPTMAAGMLPTRAAAKLPYRAAAKPTHPRRGRGGEAAENEARLDGGLFPLFNACLST